jgi:DNA uptake protein ComE-like DNA-binding protein
MIQPVSEKPVNLLLVLTLALFMTACASGENRPTNTAASNTAASNTAASNTAAGQPAASGQKTKLNLNTASENDFLATIPGFGERMAHEFEEYRPYSSIQQFRREMAKYVNAQQIAEYEKYVYVPISRNDADAATLRQIPGLDETEAQAIIAARPYATRDAFLTKLGEYVAGADLEAARAYVSD